MHREGKGLPSPVLLPPAPPEEGTRQMGKGIEQGWQELAGLTQLPALDSTSFQSPAWLQGCPTS